ncbi:MAG TPA: hypothetical protein VFC31_05555 [Candidatus Limnocylindria bacterium]|nr:hypothetical protein [Candidatus Limnocylindria bacterium]
MTCETIRSVDFRKARFDRVTLAGCAFVACGFRGIQFDRRYQPLLRCRSARQPE